MDNYENDYNSAMQEVQRLRGMAREYARFYNMIMEAFVERNWDAVRAAINWADE